MFFGGVAEMVEDDSGLHACNSTFGIDLENLSHVLREIKNDGDVAALSGERSSSAATKQRSAEIAADGDGGKDIVGIARENDTDRDLTVVGSVGRVEGAASAVEANVASDAETQGFGQPRGVGY
jgi:hypothetical protein